MAGPEETTELLERLEANRETGCLTVATANGMVGRVYVLMGKVIHAEASGLEGEPALTAAMGWPEVTLSFDAQAQLPHKQTLNIPPGPDPARSDRPLGVETLSDDAQLNTLGFASLGGGCAVVLIPGILFGIAALLSSRGVNSDEWVSAALAALATLFLLWLAIFAWYRILFYSKAVNVSGAPPRGQIPRVVDASDGVISGQPDLVLRMRVRSTLGRHGSCRVELYPGGIQIWKGAQHPEPRWQLSYSNLVHAESISMVSVGSRFASTRHFVRLITARPRMAFFFGNAWFVNRGAQVLVESLRQHGVTTISETFET